MTQDNTPIPTLKSCPFCGGTDILVQELGEGRGSANYWVAACFNPNCCEAGKTEAEAIEVWNRRAAATIPTLAEKIREIPNPFESDKFRYCFREALSAAAALVEVEAANPPIGLDHPVDAPTAPLPLVSEPGATSGRNRICVTRASKHSVAAASPDPLSLKLYPGATADGCICTGNWRAIVNECSSLIDRKFRGNDGHVYTFFGVVHGSDDYYYGMHRAGQMALLSCVGSLQGWAGWGYKLIEDGSEA